MPYFTELYSLSEWEVQRSDGLSSKKKNRSWGFFTPSSPRLPRQAETGKYSILSTVCQLPCGLVSCVLPLLWAADLTELVARATASAKEPPSFPLPPSFCFPWRPDTLIIWGIAEDVGGWVECGVAAKCLLKHRSSLKRAKWEKRRRRKCHQWFFTEMYVSVSKSLQCYVIIFFIDWFHS